nr:hypothetical protein [Methylorubrum sp. Q1]
MLLSRVVFENLEVRAGLALPALGVLDPGDPAPDGVVEEFDLCRLLRVPCDARDQRVQMGVTRPAEMQGPEHLVAAQAQFLEKDGERLLDLADRRLLARSPGQHDVLDRAAGAGSAHRGGDHLGDLPRSRVREQVELALRQHAAALGPARAAVDIGGQLRHLAGDRRAVTALVHAFADHDGASARCAIAR